MYHVVCLYEVFHVPPFGREVYVIILSGDVVYRQVILV